MGTIKQLGLHHVAIVTTTWLSKLEKAKNYHNLHIQFGDLYLPWPMYYTDVWTMNTFSRYVPIACGSLTLTFEENNRKT